MTKSNTINTGCLLCIWSGVLFLFDFVNKSFAFQRILLRVFVTYHIKASSNYVTRTMKQHSRYAISFLFVEIFGVFIAILNLFLTNAFLGGEFFSFGPAAVKYIQSPAYDFNNPLNEVFPKVGKCTWYKYGPTGTIQVHDAMCVLPLNIVNEKTYICLWVVYITTAVVTSIILIYHTIIL
ncbi:Innexin inx1 [Armadillidium nasatum]|uniref:Innexin n=1 Tax=Armadillidium nasatum TaxID=96803 RepID=A0A5N5TJY4_9CRUS|nr:Innexin inx1 [Armadillidium nasatum]